VGFQPTDQKITATAAAGLAAGVHDQHETGRTFIECALVHGAGRGRRLRLDIFPHRDEAQRECFAHHARLIDGHRDYAMRSDVAKATPK
jgi:hypothetical protein